MHKVYLTTIKSDLDELKRLDPDEYQRIEKLLAATAADARYSRFLAENRGQRRRLRR